MVKKENFDLFPTLITRYNSILNNDQIKDIFDYCLKKETVSHRSLIGTAVSSHGATSEIVDDISNNVKSCEYLKLMLQNLFDNYVDDCNIPKVKITNSWFNIQDQSSVLKQHTHPGSILSAALYVNVDDLSSGIYFDNPNNSIQYLTASKHRSASKYTYEYFRFTPQPGDLFIFPSWLHHGSGYESNMTNNRLVISLNTMYA
jgi:uncharacterized protein (TIGR02466 family)